MGRIASTLSPTDSVPSDGGLLLDHQGYRATFWFSAVLLLGSVVTSCIAARSAQHHRLPVHT